MESLERVRALIDAARRIADPRDPLGARARAALPASTGLSPQNVELALTEILELQPTEADLLQLCNGSSPSPRAHVSLASNVFVAPLRAVALALAQSSRVFVRASRREPVLCDLLHQASGAFQMVDELSPAPGDHLWAYGSDETLAELRQRLPKGVWLHAHGTGFGVAVIDGDFAGAARALGADVVPFDQRGCLSPRVAIVVGGEAAARQLAHQLADELSNLERRIPLGVLAEAERADVVRFRDTLAYAGEIWPAGSGWVATHASPTELVVPPIGRNVCVVACDDWAGLLAKHASAIAAIGLHGSPVLSAQAATALPGARRSALGRMQRPALDGPVDLRPAGRAELL